MKGKIMNKKILGVIITIIVFGLGAIVCDASMDKEEVVGTQKTVLHENPAGNSEREAPPKLDIIFVLDNSGSMKKSDPNFITKEVVTNFLFGLDKNSRLGMVIFDQEAKLVEPLTEIAVQEAGVKFLTSLDTINYKGLFTNTPAGVERAIYELKTRSRKDARKVIILLTDGIVDTGNKIQDLEKKKWLSEDLTLASKKEGIRIFGIAFTDNADFHLIQTLAYKTNGEYFRAYTADEIHDVFKKIHDGITKPLPQPKVAPLAPSPPKPVTVETRKAEPAPAPLAAPLPVKKGIALLPIVVSLLAILLGVIVLIMLLKRKTEDRIAPELYKAKIDDTLPPDHPVFQAELIDTGNIISDESLSLVLNKESVSIGRDSSNDIVIPMDSISSFHSTIEYRNGYFYLEDHRSTNGTRLNNQKLKENQPVRLKSGDKIHFAVYEFRFLLHDQAPFGETVFLKNDDV